MLSFIKINISYHDQNNEKETLSMPVVDVWDPRSWVNTDWSYYRVEWSWSVWGDCKLAVLKARFPSDCQQVTTECEQWRDSWGMADDSAISMEPRSSEGYAKSKLW